MRPLLCLIGLHAWRWSEPDLDSETQHAVCTRCGKAKGRML
jgi:hypothetical protein